MQLQELEVPTGYTARFNHLRDYEVSMRKARWNETQDVIYGHRVIKKLNPRGGLTVCILFDAATGTPRARGVATCNPRDLFVKSTGRHIALARALKALVSEQARILARERQAEAYDGYLPLEDLRDAARAHDAE